MCRKNSIWNKLCYIHKAWGINTIDNLLLSELITEMVDRRELVKEHVVEINII